MPAARSPNMIEAALVLQDDATKARILPGLRDVLESGQHPANTYTLGVFLGTDEMDRFIDYFIERRSMSNASVVFYIWMNTPGQPSLIDHPRFPEFA